MSLHEYKQKCKENLMADCFFIGIHLMVVHTLCRQKQENSVQGDEACNIFVNIFWLGRTKSWLGFSDKECRISKYLAQIRKVEYIFQQRLATSLPPVRHGDYII